MSDPLIVIGARGFVLALTLLVYMVAGQIAIEELRIRRFRNE